MTSGYEKKVIMCKIKRLKKECSLDVTKNCDIRGEWLNGGREKKA